jgi:hypothetical protein
MTFAHRHSFVGSRIKKGNDKMLALIFAMLTMPPVGPHFYSPVRVPQHSVLHPIGPMPPVRVPHS